MHRIISTKHPDSHIRILKERDLPRCVPSVRRAVIQLWTVACQYDIIMGLLFMSASAVRMQKRKRKRAAAPKVVNFLFLQTPARSTLRDLFICGAALHYCDADERGRRRSHNLASFAAIIVRIDPFREEMHSFRPENDELTKLMYVCMVLTLRQVGTFCLCETNATNAYCSL
jgi:hypothetical protein